jgi:hypothetical protein
MEEFKLKIILALLSGVFFSFIFIILAFVVPLQPKHTIIAKPQGVLEKVSHSARER